MNSTLPPHHISFPAVCAVETHHSPHIPVLSKQVLRILNPQAKESLLDLTAGFGGHASLILDSNWAWNQAVLVDRDDQAIDFLRSRFFEHRPQIMHADMVSALQHLKSEGRQFDMILADLGISSVHVDVPERGFSFMNDGPLDMRMDRSQELTAEYMVNNWQLKRLTEHIKMFGEEPHARRIAQAIVDARPLRTTRELADVVSTVVKLRGRTHPATKTFQALRIAVNDELGQLSRALELIPEIVAPGGRVAVISFHSLEDRIVKKFMRDITSKGIESQFQNLTKKPLVADNDDTNPRARSAKLRAVVKLKQTSLKQPKTVASKHRERGS